MFPRKSPPADETPAALMSAQEIRATTLNNFVPLRGNCLAVEFEPTKAGWPRKGSKGVHPAYGHLRRAHRRVGHHLHGRDGSCFRAPRPATSRPRYKRTGNPRRHAEQGLRLLAAMDWGFEFQSLEGLPTKKHETPPKLNPAAPCWFRPSS